MSYRIRIEVDAITHARAASVGSGRHVRKPYNSVRLTQMKWNGIVSQLPHRDIATRFNAAKTTHAISRPKAPTWWRRPRGRAGFARASVSSRRNAIPRMPNGLNRLGAELLPQPADADVDDVGPRVEVVAPDRREQALAAHDLAGVEDEVV
jgi:hypothetical protein